MADQIYEMIQSLKDPAGIASGMVVETSQRSPGLMPQGRGCRALGPYLIRPPKCQLYPRERSDLSPLSLYCCYGE